MFRSAVTVSDIDQRFSFTTLSLEFSLRLPYNFASDDSVLAHILIPPDASARSYPN